MPTRTSTIRYVPMLNKLETRFKESRFKMNRLIYMAGVAMAAIAISSCDEDTLTVGNSLTDENDQLHISVSMDVKSGYVLPDLAADVRRAVVDAVSTQVGATVSAVDIYIDGIQFED